MNMPYPTLKVAIGQIEPVWLNRRATTDKIIDSIKEAASQNCGLIAFSEGLLPGYPFWLEPANAARFDNESVKTWHAHYLNEAVCIENGDLTAIEQVCKETGVAAYVGIIERPMDRGGHSCYASLVYIDAEGVIGSVHRKLMPTYEERLAWSIGDGNGLRVHPLKGFTVGGLNCWENWMPFARASLYAQGENVHVASWPGSDRNTKDITRFIAMESRSYIISASSILYKSSISTSLPRYEELVENMPETLANGGSCIADPNGNWLVAPVVNDERLITAEISLEEVYKARNNFDPNGHYSRPDVFELKVNRKRQQLTDFT